MRGAYLSTYYQTEAYAMTEQEEKRGGITTHAVGTGVACIKGLTALKARHDATEARENETGDDAGDDERDAILDELHDYHYGITFRGGWHELDIELEEAGGRRISNTLSWWGPGCQNLW